MLFWNEGRTNCEMLPDKLLHVFCVAHIWQDAPPSMGVKYIAVAGMLRPGVALVAVVKDDMG